MAYCSNCGAKLPEKSKVCSNCGSSVGLPRAVLILIPVIFIILFLVTVFWGLQVYRHYKESQAKSDLKEEIVIEECLIVFCTVGSEEEGVGIAENLVEAKMAACVNIVPKLRSIYRWKGEMCDNPEVLLIIKTKKDLFEKVKERIMKLHSYEVPEVIAIPIVYGSESYLNWLLEVTQS